MKTKNRLLALLLVTVMCISVLPFTAAADSGAASVTLRYQYFDGSDWLSKDYSTTYYSTVEEAFAEAVKEPDYADKLGLTEEQLMHFFYSAPIITLYADYTIEKNATLEANTETGLTLDLNGHTFEVKGRLAGGFESEIYDSELDAMVPHFYPSNINVDSSVPGVFRSSGIIDVNLQPWTQDTYYITAGEVNGFFGADGGDINISGGVFTESVFFNNGNYEADLTINLSGNAELKILEFWVYSEAEAGDLVLTISDAVKIESMVVGIMGTLDGNKPNLIINGGYFYENPTELLSGFARVPDEEVDHNNLQQYYVDKWGEFVEYSKLDDWDKENFTDYYVYSETCWEDFIIINAEPEAYAGQNNWMADGVKFPWRVAGPSSGLKGDINGDGSVDNKDVVVLFRYVSGESAGYDAKYDYNEDGAVDNKDVVSLFRFISAA